ncbi:MAG: hypothetical protein OHK0012_26880 [Synechococcales cyanobacterium]
MILVDSSVWVDYCHGVRSSKTDFLDLMLGIEPMAIGDLILTEGLQGFQSDSDDQTAKALLHGLTIFGLLGQDLAVRASGSNSP